MSTSEDIVPKKILCHFVKNEKTEAKLKALSEIKRKKGINDKSRSNDQFVKIIRINWLWPRH